ncbi:hypothetical protein D3C72_2298310 [compost metagenome]
MTEILDQVLLLGPFFIQKLFTFHGDNLAIIGKVRFGCFLVDQKDHAARVRFATVEVSIFNRHDASLIVIFHD